MPLEYGCPQKPWLKRLGGTRAGLGNLAARTVESALAQWAGGVGRVAAQPPAPCRWQRAGLAAKGRLRTKWRAVACSPAVDKRLVHPCNYACVFVGVHEPSNSPLHRCIHYTIIL